MMTAGGPGAAKGTPPYLVGGAPDVPVVTDPLSVDGLTITYGDKPAVFSISASFPSGSSTAVIGPNGAGKSTFLKGILGIVPSLAGSVECFGGRLENHRNRIAYVPQRASVDWEFPARALEIVMMGLFPKRGWLGRFRAEDRSHALACLDAVGMADFADRQIGRLSGGQQQRVFLARALAQKADLYILDEPFAGVDAATEKTIITVLKQLQGDGKTLAVVHHDLATVADYFDRVLLINRYKVAEGPTAITFTPELLQQTYRGKLADAHIGAVSPA